MFLHNGQIGSLATQTVATGLAGKAVMAATDITGIFARNGVPKVMIPRAMDALGGIISGYYSLLRDASKPGYDKQKLADDIKDTLRQAGLEGIVEGIISQGSDFIQLVLDIIGNVK